MEKLINIDGKMDRISKNNNKQIDIWVKTWMN